MTNGDARWTALVEEAGVLSDGRLRGIDVRGAGLPSAPEDVVLCPTPDADRRLASIRANGRSTLRLAQPERVFMARAFARDPATAAAMLVRAVLARWTSMRGRHVAVDEHERRAYALVRAHLAVVDQDPGDEVAAGRDQLPAAQIRPPVAHDGPADVIRKAIEQVARQIGDRTVIVMGDAVMG